jgi:ATP-dependent DNA helicase RecQ
VLQNGHEKLSTYAIGKDRSAEEWRMLGRSLVHQGLVDESSDGYSVLKLNELSWEVLRKQRSVSVAVAPGRIAPATTHSDTDENIEALFQRLQTLRKRLADEQSVPPYVVFANSSLRLMAQQQPLNNAQFSQISGVGSRKLSQYGDVFLSEIRAFRAEKGLSLTPSTSAAPVGLPLPTPLHRSPSDTHRLTLQLFQQGLKPFEIAEQRNLRMSTVMTHLAELIEMEHDIPLHRLVPLDRQEKILDAIATVGGDSRRRIRDYLGEVYGYDEIHLVQAHWRRENLEQP